MESEWDTYCSYGRSFPIECHPCHPCSDCEAELEAIAEREGWNDL